MWWIWSVTSWASMPLSTSMISVDIDGTVAAITIDQVFVNDSSDTVTGEYEVALPDDSAVDGLSITIDERQIDLRVASATEGLVTPITPNGFAKRVSAIGPGQQVHVLLRIVQQARYTDGGYAVVVPLTSRFASDSSEVPLTSVVFSLDSPWSIKSFEVPSHDITPVSLQGQSVAFREDLSTARDLEVRWTVDAPPIAASMLIEDEQALISIEPPRKEVLGSTRTIVWVIDNSCSMQGAPLAVVEQAFRASMGDADERDRLTLVAGERVWIRRKRLDEDRRIEAISVVGGLAASGDGDPLDTLSDFLRRRWRARPQTVVILATDGRIGSDRGKLADLTALLGDTRLVVLGIGELANRLFYGELARRSGGQAVWLPAEPHALSSALDPLSAALAPSIRTDVEIDWRDWVVAEMTPNRLPALQNQPLQLAARIVTRGQEPVVCKLAGDSFPVATLEGDIGALPSLVQRLQGEAIERDRLWGIDRPYSLRDYVPNSHALDYPPYDPAPTKPLPVQPVDSPVPSIDPTSTSTGRTLPKR